MAGAGAAHSPSGPLHRRGEAGFTVAELTVTLVVLVELILAALLLFDFTNKLGKAEMQVSDMQQALRIGQHEVVRTIRMAGRGELPITNNPAAAFAANLFAGTALAVRNNVPASTGVIAGTAPTDPPSTITNPRVVTGTDVLTVRGVFSTPLYQVNAADPTSFAYDPVTGTGKVVIKDTSPTGVSQPFDKTNAPGSFADAITNARPESLILVSPVDDAIYGVAQFDPANSSIATVTDPTTGQTSQVATLAFKTTGASTPALSAGAAFPATLNNAAFVGILEEYRYYVREVHATASDLTSELNPVLSRARVYAGTDAPWNADTTNLYQDIAEGVLDLQIALGFDLNGTGVISDTGSNTDDYLFNSPADNATAAPWSTGVPWTSLTFPPLFYVRVSVLARTNRHDVQYKAPQIVAVEDHTYNTNPSNPLDPNGSTGLTMRRRLVQTVVGIRNRV